MLRRIASLIVPPLLLYLALLTVAQWLPELPVLAENPVFRALPALLLASAMVLGLCFAQTRITFTSMMVAAAFLTGSRALAMSPEAPYQARVLYWSGLLVPAGLALFHRLRERGVVSIHGAVRAALSVLACGFLVLLPQIATWPASALVAPIAPWLPLPLFALLAAVLCLPLLFFPKAYEGRALGPLMAMAGLCMLTSLGCRASVWAADRAEGVFFLFMSAAGFLLVAAVLDSAWRRANTDELTQLPARHALKHHLARLGSDYTVGLIDIDHFKTINDKYGHDCGDQVLRFVAARLREHAPGRAYRYGGEEFIILCEGDRAGAHAVAIEEARRAIGRDPFRVRGRGRPRRKPDAPPPTTKPRAQLLRITASAGVAAARADMEPFEVIQAADKALYRAKNQGRDRMCQAARN